MSKLQRRPGGTPEYRHAINPKDIVLQADTVFL